MVITDAFTKFATEVALPGKEAMHVAPALLAHFYTFGIPQQLVTDQGREYCNELEKLMCTASKIRHDVTTPYHPACNSAVETFNKILKHYIATALVDAEASTLDWEVYLVPLLFAYNTAVSSSTKVTPFKATFGYDPRVPLWEGVQYPEDEVVERKDFAEYLAEVKHTQLATREIAHLNNQHTRTEYTDKYNTANKVVYPRYVAGDKVWVKVMDKNQQAPNPKLARPWERGTIVARGVTGTSYKVDRHERKHKPVKTSNVQQLKPFAKEKEETMIAQPPAPAQNNEQQEPRGEYDLDWDEEDNLPDVDLGQEEEESEDADQDTLLPDQETPLPDQETPLSDGETPLPIGYQLLTETPAPLPETTPQSEGMMTRAQAKGGGELKHVPEARATRQLGHLARPPPPARESTGRAGQEHQGRPPARESTGQDQEQQGLEDDDQLMLRRGLLRPHAEDKDGQDGPTEDKRVYNRGELCEHDAEWEEPLLKRIKHLKEMTMRAEAARAGKRFKHAVMALSVMSYETGQKNLYRTLAAMTDGQLLLALAAGSVELSINGATPPARQPALPAPQLANTPTPRRDLPSQPT
jgi:hypothetical protein